jgi:predicted AAA+ superfamily ATPase
VVSTRGLLLVLAVSAASTWPKVPDLRKSATGKWEEKVRRRGKKQSESGKVAGNYIDLVVDKDVMEISRIRQRETLPRLLGELAARSGQVLNMSSVGGGIGLDRSTAENYIKLLEAVFLIYRLPAWGTTLGSRIARHPKVHMVDSGVMAWLLNLTPQKIAQAAPATLTEYGHLLETFAVGEIFKQVSWPDAPVAAGYFRTESGDEADLILERDDGQVIAFEVKAGTRVGGADLRGLRLAGSGVANGLNRAPR